MLAGQNADGLMDALNKRWWNQLNPLLVRLGSELGMLLILLLTRSETLQSYRRCTSLARPESSSIEVLNVGDPASNTGQRINSAG